MVAGGGGAVLEGTGGVSGAAIGPILGAIGASDSFPGSELKGELGGCGADAEWLGPGAGDSERLGADDSDDMDDWARSQLPTP